MNILPFFSRMEQQINDGEVYTLHDYCKLKFGSKCIQHYESINKPGVQICPYGFSTIATAYSIEEQNIYSSLIIDSHADSKKLKNRAGLKNKFAFDTISRLVGMHELLLKTLKSTRIQMEQETSLIRSILHEVRRFSRDINSQGTDLIRNADREPDRVPMLVDSILETLKLISVRIDSYELFKNPASITSAIQQHIAVYKKFDKARYILLPRAKENHVRINFRNESYFTINGYEIFDLLPYILLDNSVKYSPQDQVVEVTFDDASRLVTVENIGPSILEEEITKLGEMNFRGKYADKYGGSGLGLNMLVQVAELHHAKVYFEPGRTILYELNERPYSTFKVVLDFTVNHG